MLDSKKAYNHFVLLVKERPPGDFALTLIDSLLHVLKETQETTRQGLLHEMKDNTNYLTENLINVEGLTRKSSLALHTLGRFFHHYITSKLSGLSDTSLEVIRSKLVARVEDLREFVMSSRGKVLSSALEFIKDGITIFVHGNSPLVEFLLVEAAVKHNKKFSVIVSEARPDCEGYALTKSLLAVGIAARLVVDAAVAYALEEADIVLVGAETVVETGGIINGIGTYTCALCAKMLKKPFYVVCESFKFARMYPLTQKDLPEIVKDRKTLPLFRSRETDDVTNLPVLSPLCDYTPPDLVTLLFTDMGIFTPSAVSDELIQISNA
eukprot:TRINITY_DN2486_c0_g1_i1.p1 TRINITY_DN2486_c0_g1~~TRINITY_DN2486_c0_g1_i1.p1  ORF type:complete len:324 (-),score=95.08 TRINITY_DN2486_c0_g1_i1:123-1094(-)